MWSRRFEQALILRPPEGRLLLTVALAVWLAGAVLLAVAPIPLWLSTLAGVWLLGAMAADMRSWSRQPSAAIWRPGRGWVMEWPDGRRHPGRLMGSSRILPGVMALSWAVPAVGRVRLLVPARAADPTARRLRVLMRYGRGDG